MYKEPPGGDGGGIRAPLGPAGFFFKFPRSAGTTMVSAL